MRGRGDSGRAKGWIESEYERHKQMRRKKSGTCILEVQDGEGGTTHLLFRACDRLMELSASFDEQCNEFLCQPSNFARMQCRQLIYPSLLLLLLVVAAGLSFWPSIMLTAGVFPAFVALTWWRAVYFGNDRNSLLLIGLTGIAIDLTLWFYITRSKHWGLNLLLLIASSALVWLIFRIRALSQPLDGCRDMSLSAATGGDPESAKARHQARSKVCAWCGVPRSRFDHHCLFINACVYDATHRAFVLLLLLATALALVFVAGTLALCASQAQDEIIPASSLEQLYTIQRKFPGLFAVDVVNCVFILGVLGVLAQQMWGIGRNLTTNEMANYRRYYTLESRMRPADLGVLLNCAAFWCPAAGPRQPDSRALTPHAWQGDDKGWMDEGRSSGQGHALSLTSQAQYVMPKGSSQFTLSKDVYI